MWAVDVRNAEASAEIHRREWTTSSIRNSVCDFDSFSVLRRQYGVIEDLRTREEMHSTELDRCRRTQRVERCVERLFIDAERRQLPAHAHRSPLRRSTRVEPYCDRDS